MGGTSRPHMASSSSYPSWATGVTGAPSSRSTSSRDTSSRKTRSPWRSMFWGMSSRSPRGFPRSWAIRSPPVTRPATVMVSPKKSLRMGYTVPSILPHFSRARSINSVKNGAADTPVAMEKGVVPSISSGSIRLRPRQNSCRSSRSMPTPLSSWVNSS